MRNFIRIFTVCSILLAVLTVTDVEGDYITARCSSAVLERNLAYRLDEAFARAIVEQQETLREDFVRVRKKILPLEEDHFWNPFYYFLIGASYYHQSDYRNANRYFEKALNLAALPIIFAYHGFVSCSSHLVCNQHAEAVSYGTVRPGSGSKGPSPRRAGHGVSCSAK